MHRQAHIRQGVFHFRAIVKAETAHELVTKPAPAEHFFKCARLKIGPIFHGAGLRGVFIENALEFAGDKLSFCVGVSSLEIPQVGASSVFCAERLAKAFRIVGDDRAGGVQDLLRRAVISLQLDNARRSVVARKTHQDGHVRAAPTINRLVLVAHHAEVLFWAGKQPKKLVLHPVRVLVFVDVNVLESRLPLFANCWGIPQQLHGAKEEIIEIESVALTQQLFVSGENIGHTAAIFVDGFASHLLRALSVIFRVADAAQNIARRQCVIIDFQIRHNKLHRSELVVIVVNGKITRQAGIGGFASEEPSAKRMKCRQPRLRGRNACAQQQIGDAIAHLLRGLIRKRDREYRFRRHAAGD